MDAAAEGNGHDFQMARAGASFPRPPHDSERRDIGGRTDGRDRNEPRRNRSRDGGQASTLLGSVRRRLQQRARAGRSPKGTGPSARTRKGAGGRGTGSASSDLVRATEEP